MARKRSLICGIGINDADYSISYKSGNSYSKCPFYSKWKSMIYRCYSKKEHERNPSYIGCKVSDEWLIFSNFKKWMESQDWNGKQLDKDLLSSGEKIYSADTCCFVSDEVNNFIVGSVWRDGTLAGVSWCKNRKMYQAHISDPFLKKSVALGRFNTKEEAHLAWILRKIEIAAQLAMRQTDKRVKSALLSRFSMPNGWTDDIDEIMNCFDWTGGSK